MEGAFRNACETALSTLRSGSPALLALLSAIMHDPLVNWGAEHDGAGAKKVTPTAFS